MRAVVFEEPHRWALTDVPDPEPGPGEVRLRSVVTGVCAPTCICWPAVSWPATR